MELSNQIITHEMKRVFKKYRLNGNHGSLSLTKALVFYFRDKNIDDMEDLQNALDSLADQLQHINGILAVSTLNHDTIQTALAAWYLEGYAYNEYNPHNYKPYIFDSGKFWGLGYCCQDALDYAIDAGQFDEFLVNPEDIEDPEDLDHMFCGGNAGEYFDYDLTQVEVLE